MRDKSTFPEERGEALYLVVAQLIVKIIFFQEGKELDDVGVLKGGKKQVIG